jgi:hypothetical protein
MKVKREATSCFGVLHQHVGPGLKALAISLAKQASVKELLQKCFDENPFDSSIQSTGWARISIVGRGNLVGGRGQSASSALALDVPKTDLFAALPADTLAKLVSSCLSLFAVHGYRSSHQYLGACRGRRMARPRGKCERKPWMKSKQPSRAAVDSLRQHPRR